MEIVPRPGLAILPIDEGLLQVGTSPGHSFTLSNLSVEDERWLKGIARRSHVKEEKARRRDDCLTPRRQKILELLELHDLVVPAPVGDVSPSIADLHVRVSSMDRIGIPIARLLHASGARYLDMRDHRLVDREVEYLFSPEAKGLPRTRVLKEEMKGAHMYLARQTDPHLVISVENRVIEHGRAALLRANEVSHLPVVVDDRSVQVGPLFIPGMTCCFLCLDYHYVDQIPHWPRLREDLRRTSTPTPTPGLAMAAAGMAVTLIDSIMAPARTLAADPSPEGARDEFPWYQGLSWRVFEGGVQELRWSPHERCDCRAPQRV